jgi:hypothetical protein
MNATTRRYKQPDELTVDEHVQTVRAQNRGEPTPKFEREEYLLERTAALRDAGLDEEADELDPKRPTMATHLAAVRRRRPRA